MAKQKQKGGKTPAQISVNRQPSGKRTRNRQIQAQAELASQRRAAQRRLNGGTATYEDRKLLHKS